MTGPNSGRAFLCLGGNLGEPRATMAAALRMLDAHAGVNVVRVSALYRTPPWGKTDQPDFLNAVAEIETSLAAHALLELCLDTERELKRERLERWGPRVIDIDILVYDDEQIADERLQIPHPRMLERAFVLMPFAEIAPGLMLDGKPVEDHLCQLDTSGIERISTDGKWWKAA